MGRSNLPHSTELFVSPPQLFPKYSQSQDVAQAKNLGVTLNSSFLSQWISHYQVCLHCAFQFFFAMVTLGPSSLVFTTRGVSQLDFHYLPIPVACPPALALALSFLQQWKWALNTPTRQRHTLLLKVPPWLLPTLEYSLVPSMTLTAWSLAMSLTSFSTSLSPCLFYYSMVLSRGICICCSPSWGCWSLHSSFLHFMPSLSKWHLLRMVILTILLKTQSLPVLFTLLYSSSCATIWCHIIYLFLLAYYLSPSPEGKLHDSRGIVTCFVSCCISRAQNSAWLIVVVQ